MLIQPTHDRGHIGCVKRMLFQKSAAVNAVLSVEPDNAIKINGNGIENNAHLCWRAAGTDEDLDAIGL